MTPGSLAAKKLLIGESGFCYYPIIFIIYIEEVFIGRDKSRENKAGYGILTCFTDIRHQLDLKPFLPGILNIKFTYAPNSIMKNLVGVQEQAVSVTSNDAKFIFCIPAVD